MDEWFYKWEVMTKIIKSISTPYVKESLFFYLLSQKFTEMCNLNGFLLVWFGDEVLNVNGFLLVPLLLIFPQKRWRRRQDYSLKVEIRTSRNGVLLHFFWGKITGVLLEGGNPLNGDPHSSCCVSSDRLLLGSNLSAYYMEYFGDQWLLTWNRGGCWQGKQKGYFGITFWNST